MSAKLSRLRYPEARFLTILTIRVEALTDGIGQISVGEDDDVIEVISHRGDEPAQ